MERNISFFKFSHTRTLFGYKYALSTLLNAEKIDKTERQRQLRLDLKKSASMLSTSRSQKQNFSENVAKLKSKSASPTQIKNNKKQSEEKQIQSSTSDRELGKLSVQEIVSKLIYNGWYSSRLL